MTSITSNPSLSADKKQKETTKQLNEIRNKLLDLKVIFVTVDNEDNAYVIFETLNSRGKDLTVSDLLKNYLLRELRKTNADVDIARDKWLEMLGTFDRSSAHISVDSFLLHQWLSHDDYVSKKKLFREMKTVLKGRDLSLFLSDLVADSAIYRAMRDPEYRRWTREEAPLRRSVDALNLFGVEQPSPYVLAVLRAYLSGEIKLALAKRAIRAVECFHFMFTAVTNSSSSGGISKMYAAYARNVSQAHSAQHASVAVDELIKKLRARLPTQAEFESSFTELAYSSDFTQQKKVVRYALEEQYLACSTGVVPDFERMTIEHIAPESSHASLGKKAVATIGNLMLVGENLNGALGDKPFEQKRKLLASPTTNVWVDPLVLSEHSWDKAAIERRAKVIAKDAFASIWRF